MDYNFGFKTASYPEQLTIWKVEYLSGSTAKLIVMNIGDGEVTINNIQVNGINATFEPITLQEHSNNDNFKVTLQDESFILGSTYEFVATTTKGSHFINKTTCNQSS